MTSGIAVLFATALIVGSPDRIDPSRFECWYASSLGGTLKIPRQVEERAKGFRYVFVEGFRNERMPGYFAQNIAELRARGIARRSIHVIEPSSRRTIEANAASTRDQFLEIATKGPERLVVIAHSRGACDTLSFAVENPDFVRDRVEAMFLIQGPFGGSGVAEFVLGQGQTMDHRLPTRHRIVGQWLARLVRSTSRQSEIEAMAGMTRESSKAFWSRALGGSSEPLAVVGSKTYYIRAEVEPKDLKAFRRSIAWYLKTYYGPNDGVVAVADQSLPGFGTVLATVEAGHADLTYHWPASRAPRALRRALIRSIVMAVGQN